ncbi:hypothetical protein BpHYR1_029550 [Brachionus plicatilis]|uniref:Uncharacterized protein n=1 Tax=Brachionus plicatilis TaxID=10195 RepID=A0A3M7QNB6_BRAPC|nr:hypothetical protein BpHYR1_029550 [Brachionus plicatilis]
MPNSPYFIKKTLTYKIILEHKKKRDIFSCVANHDKSYLSIIVHTLHHHYNFNLPDDSIAYDDRSNKAQMDRIFIYCENKMKLIVPYYTILLLCHNFNQFFDDNFKNFSLYSEKLALPKRYFQMDGCGLAEPDFWYLKDGLFIRILLIFLKVHEISAEVKSKNFNLIILSIITLIINFKLPFFFSFIISQLIKIYLRKFFFNPDLSFSTLIRAKIIRLLETVPGILNILIECELCKIAIVWSKPRYLLYSHFSNFFMIEKKTWTS